MTDFNTIQQSIEQLSAKLGELETVKKSVEGHEAAINDLAQKGLKAEHKAEVVTKSAIDVAFETLQNTNFAGGAGAKIELPFGSALVSKALKGAASPSTVTTVENPKVTDLGTAINGAYTYGFQTAVNYVASPGLDQAHWVRYLVGQDVGAASVLANETDKLPQLNPTYQEATIKAATAGAHAKLSRAVIESRPALETAISVVLGRSLAKCLDGYLANGGNGYNGILKTTASFQSAYSDLLSAIPDLQNYLAINGLADTDVVLVANPADVISIYNKVDTLGRYLVNPNGSYTDRVLDSSLRGVDVRYSELVPTGRFFVILKSYFELHVSESATVQFGLTGDDLISNQVTAVLSTRVAPVDLLNLSAIELKLKSA